MAGAADGLSITSGYSTVRGLVINRFTGNGIELDEIGYNAIAGNYIGTDVTGDLERGNTGHGIRLYWHSGTNTIGGTALTNRNVISDNGASGI